MKFERQNSNLTANNAKKTNSNHLFANFGSIKSFVMEPLALIYGFATTLYSVSTQTAIYRKNCLQTYLNDANVDCTYLARTPDAEDIVQHSVSFWLTIVYGIVLSSSILPLLISGSVGDKYGRKLILLCGITGSTIFTIGYMVIIGNIDTSIYVVIPFVILGMSMGSFETFITSIYAYQAGLITNKRILTQRLAGIQFALTLGNALGGLAVGFANATPIYFLMTNQFLYIIMFTYIMIIVKDKRTVVIPVVKTESEGNSNTTLSKKGKRNVFSEAYTMLVQTIRCLLKQRIRNRRFYIWIIYYIFLTWAMVSVGMAVTFPVYVFRRPFEWNASKLGIYNTIVNTSGLCCTLFGAILLKRLKITEPAIIIICVLSLTLWPIIIGIAKNDTMLFIAGALGSITNLYIPTAKAFLIACIEPGELGQIFTGVTLSNSIGILIVAVGFNTLYAFTEKTFPGLIFLLQGGLCSIGLMGAIFIYFDSKKDVNLRRAIQEMTSGQRENEKPKTITIFSTKL